MKTKLFTFVLLAAFFFIISTAHAQRKAVQAAPVKQPAVKEKIAVAPGSGCNVLNYPIPDEFTLTYYVTGTGGKYGYVAGTNAYNDKEKANYFELYGRKYRYIQGVRLYFAKVNSNKPINLNKDLFVKIYDVAADGKPGNELVSKALKLSQAAKKTAAGKTIGVQFDSSIPIPVSGKFFVSLDISNFIWVPSIVSGTRDSISLVTTSADDIIPGQGWELWEDGVWYDMNTAWGGFNTALAIFPYVSETPEGCSSAFLQEPEERSAADAVVQSKVAAIKTVQFANPFTGALRMNLNLATTQPVAVYVYDMQGKLVASQAKKIYNASVNNITVPGTENLKTGIYSVKIIAGSEQAIYKAVKQ